MFSGTGRHRRPRQAPAFVVAAGATTAGLALPLLGTGAAHATDRVAVDGAVWDEVAECESGGEWTADRGNGYYGGFQLPLTSWEEYGGAEFAERPDLASRAQQITVAERILAEEGPRAFPACALRSGLTAEYRAGHDVREGLPDDDPTPEETSDGDTTSDEEPPADEGASDEESAAERTDAPSADERETGTGDRERAGETGGADEESHDPAEKGADRDGETSGSPSAPGPDEQRTDEDTAADPPGGETDRGAAEADRTDPDGAEDSASGGRHRGDAAPDDAERAGEHGGGRHSGAPADVPHEVVSGDTLSAIAADHRLPGGWPALYAANTGVVGDDPDHILPGQRLVVPAG